MEIVVKQYQAFLFDVVIAIHHSFNGNNDLSQSIKQISSY